MTIIPVGLGDRAYDIVIERGLLSSCGALLATHAKNGRIVIVTDAHVARLHRAALEAAAKNMGLRVDHIIIPAGETSKSWKQLAELTDQLIALEIERTDPIVALGGGVIGDLTGFAAAIVKRGCPVIQVPTTLLSQVDSSVGGKTAINTKAGKNLVGVFYQPSLVLIDPDTLSTLPPRELRAGYAEVVKYGLIDDPEFFNWCEHNGAQLLSGDVALREYAIAHSVAAKARIVGEDEREISGRRALLNLGHTFGHALEAATHFSDVLLHGEAVAAGMAIAYRFSAARGLCPTDDAKRVAAHLKAVGLPIHARSVTDADGKALAAHMAHDKKKSGGHIPFLLAHGIGQTFLARDVTLDEVAAFLDQDG